MSHEINGPEQMIVTRVDAMNMAMPGQLRIPKNIAIIKHVAQFDTYHPKSETEKRYEQIQLLLDRVPNKRLIKYMASLCDRKYLDDEHPLRRATAHMQSHYRKNGVSDPKDLSDMCGALCKEENITLESLSEALAPKRPTGK